MKPDTSTRDSRQRLDQAVFSKLDVSRSFAAKLIEDGKVQVNKQVQLKPSYRLRQADKLKIDYKPAKIPKIKSIKIPVLYEDDDAIVINKPVGVLSHSKGEYNPEPTVETWLKPYLKNLEGNRAGIVHRLDRLTSGVMICAKTPEAMSWLQKQFSQRKTKKTYLAIIEGKLTNSEAIIDMAIERNPKKPQTFRVGINGKSAKTAYKVLKESKKYSLIELKPATGRTHQLRVHLQKIGHPIVGDNLYGGKEAERMFLHALSLELTLPSHERMTFEAKAPKIFKDKMA